MPSDSVFEQSIENFRVQQENRERAEQMVETLEELIPLLQERDMAEIAERSPKYQSGIDKVRLIGLTIDNVGEPINSRRYSVGDPDINLIYSGLDESAFVARNGQVFGLKPRNVRVGSGSLFAGYDLILNGLPNISYSILPNYIGVVAWYEMIEKEGLLTNFGFLPKGNEEPLDAIREALEMSNPSEIPDFLKFSDILSSLLRVKLGLIEETEE